MEKVQELVNQVSGMLQTDSILAKIAIALILFFIGWNVISLIAKILGNTLAKQKIDKTLLPFINSLVLWLLRAMLFIVVASYLGVETTSFVALIGAVGFAIGMALQGALGNFAGGVLILLNKPYKIGDLIESQGHTGVVKEIQIFNTILLSPENKTIILPNGAVANGDIVNYTVEGLIRVDLSIGISYDADIKKAKEVLLDVMAKNPNVLKEPAAFVGVSELGDSSVNLAVRPYTTPDKYWDVYFSVYEDGKNALDVARVEIPYPHLEVNLKK